MRGPHAGTRQKDKLWNRYLSPNILKLRVRWWSVARPAILSPRRSRPGHRLAKRRPAGTGEVPRATKLREQDYGRAVIVNARLLVKW